MFVVLFDYPWPVAAFGIAGAAAVIFMHRQNIRRLWGGTEHRFELRRPRRGLTSARMRRISDVRIVSDRASNLVAGISGILFVVGSVVGFGLLVGTLPEPGASVNDVRDFLDRSEIRVWAGGYVGLIGVLFFLVFAGRLWGLLRMAEGEPGWISTTALAAATAVVATSVAGVAVPAAAGFYGGQRNLDPEIVGALFDARHFSEIITPLLLAVFLGCVGFVVLRTGALPRWLGWAAGAIAALSIVAVPFGYEASEIPAFLSALWILAVSIVFIVRRETVGRPT